MPNIYLTREERLKNRMTAWLTHEMRIRRMRQIDMAKIMGISQQALSMKIKLNSYSHQDILCFFDTFEPDSETVSHLMGVNE